MDSPRPIKLRLLDLYRIGPGPSSSHTVGPMRAALRFRERCLAAGITPASLQVELLGSLSATGRGHGSDRAVLAGLSGWQPETCDPEAFNQLIQTLKREPTILWGGKPVALHPSDVSFGARDSKTLPHPNTLVCRALDATGAVLLAETWCSVGGGFVLRIGGESEPEAAELAKPVVPFHDGTSLLAQAHKQGGHGAVVLANEAAWEQEPGPVAVRSRGRLECVSCLHRTRAG